MTVLLYDYCELEERTSRNFKIWKAWHISIYVLVALFGIVNYTFLEGTLQLYDANCILYPRKLEFHEVNVPCFNETVHATSDYAQEKNETPQNTREIAQKENGNAPPGQNTSVVDVDDKNITRERREITSEDFEFEMNDNEIVLEGCIGNKTSWSRPALDVGRTLFGNENNCQRALYTPLASTIFAAVWVTMFTMCPGGGRPRAGLQQPWRILAPALVFAVVLAIVTGHSFSRTSSGLHDFCAGFVNLTNTTTCSPVSLYTESAWNTSLGIGDRVAVTRAASAGVWAGWACTAALLLARCLAAPDFVVRRTGVLLKDPQQKITSRLKKSPKKQHVQFAFKSGGLKDDISLRSEPTLTSELVTASVEHHEGSAPSSVFNTPLKRTNEQDSMLEMSSLPHIDDKIIPDQYQ